MTDILKKERIFNLMANEFILDFYNHYKSLKKLDYSNQKIAEKIKYSSKVETYLIFLKNSNIEKQKKEELEELFNQLIQIIIKTNEFQKLEEDNFYKIEEEDISKLKNKLKEYLNIICLYFPSLCYEEYTTKNNIKVMDFYDLNIKAKLVFLKNPPYKKIQIQEKDGKYKFLVMDLHPISQYREEKLEEILPKITIFLENLKFQTKDYTEKEWLNSFSVVLFDSFFPITQEIGVLGKIPPKIIQNIERVDILNN